MIIFKHELTNDLLANVSLASIAVGIIPVSVVGVPELSAVLSPTVVVRLVAIPMNVISWSAVRPAGDRRHPSHSTTYTPAADYKYANYAQQ